MIENQKYKISSMAKDLNMKSKELIDLFAANGMEDRKHSSVITPEEFNIIMNVITEKKQVENFDDYMNGVAKIFTEASPEEKAEEKAASDSASVDSGSNKETEASKSAAEEKSAESKTAGTAQGGAQQSGGKTAADTARQNKKPLNNPQRYNQQRDNNARFANKPDFSSQNRDKKNKQQTRPQQPANINANVFQRNVKPQESGNIQITEQTRRAAVNTRVVDTRTTDVDLSKYDEKLDTFVTETKNNSYQAEKQKLKKQNNKFGKSDRERMAMEKLKKQELERARKQPVHVSIPDEITVGELAQRLKVTASDVIKRLVLLGVMATVNQTIDYDTAFLIADEIGAVVTHEVKVTIEDKLFDEKEDPSDSLIPRAPVVVVMGHVDHGKTSLLDAIRHTNVTVGEAGGITQHIGAYRVSINGQDITFLDTPGHEAFTAMRARGAQATDIAILVVAADDGIMPQTVEAINHAKAAGLEIIVAINKMDKPGANPDNIKQGLTAYDLIPEEWGGDVICVPVSALTRKNIDTLLESVLMIADMKELKANPDRRAKGIVIEAKLDKGRGPVATVLVQNGTLKSGDIIIAGMAVGRVRAMKDDKGNAVKTAGPSVPVEIVGLSDVPQAGDEFNAVEDEKMARALAEQRRAAQRDRELNVTSKANLDDLFAQISDGVKELNIVVKADVGGSVEAVKSSLEKLSNDEVKVKTIHSAVGGITEGDVMLAAASNAIIVGFNVRPDKNAMDSADRQGVDIRTYRVIYDCIDEITAAIKGMLAPTYKEVVLGHAQVRQTIHVSSVGTIAGCYVQDGKITRSSQIRVVRDGIVIYEDKIASLRRFKDDVKEVQMGYECGVGLERFNDIKEGDILEAFENVEQKA